MKLCAWVDFKSILACIRCQRYTLDVFPGELELLSFILVKADFNCSLSP